jgi:hypothetical protein
MDRYEYPDGEDQRHPVFLGDSEFRPAAAG